MAPGSSDVTQDGYQDVAGVSRSSRRMLRASVSGHGSSCCRAGSHPGLACPYPSAVARACQPPHAMKTGMGGPKCHNLANPNLLKAWKRRAAYGDPWRSCAADASRSALDPWSDAVTGSPFHSRKWGRNLSQARG